jgi:ATP-dependent DNA helicase RecQ
LIPSSVNLMALTATASNSLISHVISYTGMIDPVIVHVSPNKENLRYGVQMIESIYDFLPLVMLLKRQRTSFTRTIIYCRRQLECGQLFQLFKNEMGAELSEPIGAPYSLPEYRLVDSFSKGTEDHVKDKILHNCTSKSVLRLIICTAAFGMGINCVDVGRVIHWGPPNDVEMYIQQTGRSGRSGDLSFCTLLYGKGLMRYCEKQMITYCKNISDCRRAVLFSDFKVDINSLTKCNCCDICADVCNCTQCVNMIKCLKVL